MRTKVIRILITATTLIQFPIKLKSMIFLETIQSHA